MMQIVLIGLAAGVASALLFSSFASGSLLSIPLFYLSPLPILIAALGWSHLAALAAVGFAGGVVALLLGWGFLLAFVIGVGLPAWWLGYLAMLARPSDDGETLEWYPIGRLLLWVAALAALVSLMALLTIATDAETLRRTLQTMMRAALAGVLPPDAPMPRSLTEYPELVLAPTGAAFMMLDITLVLWLAARVAAKSGRLRRPWPELSAFALPPVATPLLIASLVGAVVLSDMAKIAALMLSTTLVLAYAFLGLAVLHSLTRSINGRGLILGAVYGAIVVFVWPAAMIAVLGMAEAALQLRGRVARQVPPGEPPQ